MCFSTSSGSGGGIARRQEGDGSLAFSFNTSGEQRENLQQGGGITQKNESLAAGLVAQLAVELADNLPPAHTLHAVL